MRIISILVICFSVLVGCDGRNPKMTIEDGKEWFQENKMELLELRELLLKRPVIKRVTPDMSHKYIKNYNEFDLVDRIVYNYLEERCRALKIHTISSWRSSKNSELLGMDFVIDRHGIAVSGCSISIEYNTNEKSIKSVKDSGNVVEDLDIVDWYIVYSES